MQTNESIDFETFKFLASNELNGIKFDNDTNSFQITLELSSSSNDLNDIQFINFKFNLQDSAPTINLAFGQLLTSDSTSSSQLINGIHTINTHNSLTESSPQVKTLFTINEDVLSDLGDEDQNETFILSLEHLPPLLRQIIEINPNNKLAIRSTGNDFDYETIASELGDKNLADDNISFANGIITIRTYLTTVNGSAKTPIDIVFTLNDVLAVDGVGNPLTHDPLTNIITTTFDTVENISLTAQTILTLDPPFSNENLTYELIFPAEEMDPAYTAFHDAFVIDGLSVKTKEGGHIDFEEFVKLDENDNNIFFDKATHKAQIILKLISSDNSEYNFSFQFVLSDQPVTINTDNTSFTNDGISTASVVDNIYHINTNHTLIESLNPHISSLLFSIDPQTLIEVDNTEHNEFKISLNHLPPAIQNLIDVDNNLSVITTGQELDYEALRDNLTNLTDSLSLSELSLGTHFVEFDGKILTLRAHLITTDGKETTDFDFSIILQDTFATDANGDPIDYVSGVIDTKYITQEQSSLSAYTLFTIDPPTTADTYTLAFAGSAQTSFNSAFEINGLTVKLKEGGQLDFEEFVELHDASNGIEFDKATSTAKVTLQLTASNGTVQDVSFTFTLSDTAISIDTSSHSFSTDATSSTHNVAGVTLHLASSTHIPLVETENPTAPTALLTINHESLSDLGSDSHQYHISIAHLPQAIQDLITVVDEAGHHLTIKTTGNPINYEFIESTLSGHTLEDHDISFDGTTIIAKAFLLTENGSAQAPFLFSFDIANAFDFKSDGTPVDYSSDGIIATSLTTAETDSLPKEELFTVDTPDDNGEYSISFDGTSTAKTVFDQGFNIEGLTVSAIGQLDFEKFSELAAINDNGIEIDENSNFIVTLNLNTLDGNGNVVSFEPFKFSFNLTDVPVAIDTTTHHLTTQGALDVNIVNDVHTIDTAITLQEHLPLGQTLFTIDPDTLSDIGQDSDFILELSHLPDEITALISVDPDNPLQIITTTDDFDYETIALELGDKNLADDNISFANGVLTIRTYLTTTHGSAKVPIDFKVQLQDTFATDANGEPLDYVNEVIDTKYITQEHSSLSEHTLFTIDPPTTTDIYTLSFAGSAQTSFNSAFEINGLTVKLKEGGQLDFEEFVELHDASNGIEFDKATSTAKVTLQLTASNGTVQDVSFAFTLSDTAISIDTSSHSFSTDATSSTHDVAGVTLHLASSTHTPLVETENPTAPTSLLTINHESLSDLGSDSHQYHISIAHLPQAIQDLITVVDETGHHLTIKTTGTPINYELIESTLSGHTLEDHDISFDGTKIIAKAFLLTENGSAQAPFLFSFDIANAFAFKSDGTPVDYSSDGIIATSLTTTETDSLPKEELFTVDTPDDNGEYSISFAGTFNAKVVFDQGFSIEGLTVSAIGQLDFEKFSELAAINYNGIEVDENSNFIVALHLNTLDSDGNIVSSEPFKFSFNLTDVPVAIDTTTHHLTTQGVLDVTVVNDVHTIDTAVTLQEHVPIGQTLFTINPDTLSDIGQDSDFILELSHLPDEITALISVDPDNPLQIITTTDDFDYETIALELGDKNLADDNISFANGVLTIRAYLTTTHGSAKVPIDFKVQLQDTFATDANGEPLDYVDGVIDTKYITQEHSSLSEHTLFIIDPTTTADTYTLAFAGSAQTSFNSAFEINGLTVKLKEGGQLDFEEFVELHDASNGIEFDKATSTAKVTLQLTASNGTVQDVSFTFTLSDTAISIDTSSHSFSTDATSSTHDVAGVTLHLASSTHTPLVETENPTAPTSLLTINHESLSDLGSDSHQYHISIAHLPQAIQDLITVVDETGHHLTIKTTGNPINYELIESTLSGHTLEDHDISFDGTKIIAKAFLLTENGSAQAPFLFSFDIVNAFAFKSD